MAEGESFGRDVSVLRNRPLTTIFVAIALVLAIDLLRQLATGGVLLADILSLLKNGIILGMSVGLAGIGLSMTYSILNFANFAHGDLITAGAFAGWITTFVLAGFGEFPLEALVHVGGPIPVNTGTLGVSIANTPLAVVLGLVVSAVAAAAVAVATDRIVFKPMRDQSGISLLIASVGVALVLRHLIVFALQASSRGVTAGQKTPSMSVSIGAGSIPLDAHEVTLVVVAALLMIGTHVLLRYTKLGTAMRAMADNEDLARVTGIPTERVVRATWLVGGALSGASGFLIALERGVLTTTLGWSLLLVIFAAVILGGIGSVYGAIAGGLVIGIASRLSLVWIPESFILVAAFLVMIAMLLIRPSGLLGGVTTV
ncbi:MAG: branched-chain amino acid ABC transporter permease [Salinirussus sp.]